VILGGKGRPKAFQIRKKGGTIVVHELKQEAYVCQAFVKLFNEHYGANLAYRGESLAAVCQRVFEAVLKGKRRPLSHQERDKLPKACEQHGAQNLPLDVDHIAPLHTGGEDTTENLQVLRVACHAAKTHTESLSADEHCLLSRFCVETHEAFVESRKSPQLVCDFVHQEAGALSVDIIRSRFSAFVEQTANDLPVFSPTDEILPRTEKKLADYHLIDAGGQANQRGPWR
jgi:hypothetical protein